MSFWDKNPLLFQVLIVILSVVMLILSGIIINRIVTTVFSGTGYAPLPSKFYVKQDVPAQRLVKDSNNKVSRIKEPIKIGNFITTIN